MYTRILQVPKTSFFLLGMRGTGKSSWVRLAFPNAPRFDLLSESLFQRYLANVGLFAQELATIPRDSWIVVDEVQRLPALLNEVHRAIEEHAHKFALLGSSARKLRREGVNLLGGRALMRTMYPLLPSELGKDFNLERALQFGTLPLVEMSESPAEQLDAYVQLYLKEEIQAEALAKNLPGFARFLPIAALFHGQTLNISALGRDAGISRNTAEGYIGILEDTLLAYRLPGFEARLRVKERRNPKLYWLDSGVVRAAKGASGVPSSEERGALFEGFIAMLLRAGKDLRFCEYDSIAYWAPSSSRTEVDFVIERGKEKFAIEVKSAREPGTTHLQGLRAIADLSGLQRRILVYPGKHDRRTEDQIDIFGFETFLKQLMSDQLLRGA